MSRDLIIFDPLGLKDFPSGTDSIVDAVNKYIATTEQIKADPSSKPTSKIKSIIASMEQKYGDIHSKNAPWTMWPPSVIANGRYCVFNLGFDSDITNMTISFSEAAQSAGVILIDPQGREPLLSAPDGSGILDF